MTSAVSTLAASRRGKSLGAPRPRTAGSASSGPKMKLADGIGDVELELVERLS